MKEKKEFRKLGKNMPNSERTPMKSKYPKRNFSITRKGKDEMYHAKVTDSYGNNYDNWFEDAHKANDWIYYIWDNEDKFVHQDSMKLLEDAIWGCTKLDEKLGLLKGNRDNLD
tara:strand:+ start:335 stop:673 length:339 start_codon:yes stop_codon:yes gene_type:complete